MAGRRVRNVALGAFLACVSGASGAAGIPTLTAASDLQRGVNFVQELLLWEKQARQLGALIGSRNFGDVIRNPLLKGYLPEGFADLYRAAEMTDDALNGTAYRLRRETRRYDACARLDDPNRRAACQSRAVRGAVEAAFAIDTALLIDERRDNINALRGLINTTPDVKAVAELQARIQTEQAAIANEETALRAYDMKIRAEEKLDAQDMREMAAETYSSTTLPDFAPVSFGGAEDSAAGASSGSASAPGQ